MVHFFGVQNYTKYQYVKEIFKKEFFLAIYQLVAINFR